MECSACDSAVSTAPTTPDIREDQHLRNGNGCSSILRDNSLSINSENQFMEDFDTYWDELGDRLSISQTVDDSIMREMVKAVCEEAKEKIASKEREIYLLNSKLNKYKNTDIDVKLPNFAVIDDEITRAVLRLRRGLMEAGLDLCYQAQFEKFRASLEEQIQALKGEVEQEKIDALNSVLNFSFEQINHIFGVLKSVIFENQWEHELQKEVSSIVFRSYFEGFYEEFESKLQEKLGAWKLVLQELNILREELNSISKSLLESDMATASVKVKDHDTTTVAGTDKTLSENEMANLEVYLKHMSKEETIDYFKGEITKMRRQHETAMHERTEELFKLKRDLLKVRNSAPLRKDKDFEYVKQRLPEVIVKLDEVMLKEVKLRVSCADKVEEIRRLEGRINQLVHENRNLKDLVEDTRKSQSLLDEGVIDQIAKLSVETEALKGRIDCLLSENSNLRDLLENTRKVQSLSEEQLLGKIKDLSAEIEDLQVLSEVGTTVNQTVLAEILYGSRCKFEDQKIKSIITEQKLGKEKPSVGIDQEMQKLNEITSVYLGENEKFTIETGSRLAIQNRKIEIIIGDIETLREKLKTQFDSTSDSKREIELTKNRLHEALVLAARYEMELEKQRDLIDRNRKENQTVSSLLLRKEKEGKMVLDFISHFTEKILAEFRECENKLQQSIKSSENRLRTLVSEFGTLVQQFSQSRQNELVFKQLLEIRTSNLAKAEAEVDLLGDEVDALTSLLGKLYIALDHYSPVFVHYPGVMEILKLIKKELQGEI
ncbi:WPP domain-associated protein-like protein [Carex littledalei]|uniref:WPP domain-associated protein-like protein n=1 Tax=Carex littledalei TaxID=544730 RepID=A0A833R5T9_9POAL|nr:WPP domain-associated protein-like protein [Carex littledalei]